MRWWAIAYRIVRPWRAIGHRAVVVFVVVLASGVVQSIASAAEPAAVEQRCSPAQVAVVQGLLATTARASLASATTGAGLRQQSQEASLRTEYVLARDLLVEALRLDLARQPAALDVDIAADLSRLARIALWRSELGPAAELLQCALALLPGQGETPDTAAIRAQMAEGEIELGHWSAAETMLFQALGTLRNADDAAAGDLAYALGVEARRRLANPPPDITSAWYEGVADLYGEALVAYDRYAGCPAVCNNRAIVQTSLAEVLQGSPERLDQARRLAQVALGTKLAQVGPANDSVATSFQTLAHIAERQGKREQALADHRRAVGILLAMERRKLPDAVAILSRIAVVSEDAASFCERLGTPEGSTEAILLYTVSVEARQRMRRAGETLPPTYQEDLVRAIEGPYHRLANLLVEAGRLAEAEQILGLLKREELVALLRGERSSGANVSGTHEQAADYSRLAARWLEQTAELARLEAIEPDRRGEADRRDLAALRQAASDQQKEFQRFIATLTLKPSDDLHRWVDLQSSRLGQATLADPKAFGIQYIVEGSRLGIIVVSGGRARGLQQPVAGRRLSQLVEAFRTAAKQRGDVSTPSRQLWNLLVQPVLPFLRDARPETLVISTTGALRYLPFAALQDSSGRFLVEDYALVAWADAGEGRPGGRLPGWNVDAMGLVTTWGSFENLPNVETELHGIVLADDNPQGLIPGRIWVDDSFDHDRFETALRGPANIVHVASHFNFVPGHEDQSVLVLGRRGETLSIDQIRAFDFGRIDLLTLSACETALGGGYANGFEVEGLTAAVLQRGGRTVMASLWKIGDESAAEFMRRFYARLAADPGGPVSQALRQTQLAFLGSPQALPRAGPSVPARWAEPRFWAPFVLSGSWK